MHELSANVVVGEVRNALRASGVAQNNINHFLHEIDLNDYDSTMRIAAEWVTLT